MLGIQLSKDGGSNFNTKLEKTFAAAETTETYGNGSTELWGTAWTGADMTDANFRLRLIAGVTAKTVDLKTFGFTVGASNTLTGIEVAVEAKWDGTYIYVDHVKVKIYYGTSVLPVVAGSQAYASDGRKAGEGAGLGTGVLTFFDGNNWIAVDSGGIVAA